MAILCLNRNVWGLNVPLSALLYYTEVYRGFFSVEKIVPYFRTLCYGGILLRKNISAIQLCKEGAWEAYCRYCVCRLVRPTGEPVKPPAGP